jgi:hypothetical protein
VARIGDREMSPKRIVDFMFGCSCWSMNRDLLSLYILSIWHDLSRHPPSIGLIGSAFGGRLVGSIVILHIP